MRNLLMFQGFIIGLFCVNIIAGPVNITGQLINNDSTFIGSATLRLAKAGLTTISNDSGNFILKGLIPTGISLQARNQNTLVPIFKHGLINFAINGEDQPITLNIFTLTGSLIAHVSYQKVIVGNHSINPFRTLSKPLCAGVIIANLNIGNKYYYFKISTHNISKYCTSSQALLKQAPALAKLTTPTIDTIIILKSGYFESRILIDTYSIDLKKVMLNLIFKTVTINTQTWMMENYSGTNGLLYAQSNSAWRAADSNKIPAYCYYDGDVLHKYGPLYNWYAANQIKIAGWHLPDTNDWNTLEKYCQGYTDTSSGTSVATLLAAARSEWPSTSAIPASPGYNNLSPNNGTGFTALPGGVRYKTIIPPTTIQYPFGNVGSYGDWWTASSDNDTTAFSRSIYYSSISLNLNVIGKGTGCSIRLVRDN
jgi:uncharacterized protein (TIGR02145 family)